MAGRSRIQWFGCGKAVAEERIAEVQKRLAVRFPPAFLDWVRECDGGDPGDLAYEVRVPGYDQPWTYGVGRLMSFREPMPREAKQRLLVEPDAWRELGFEPWTSIEDYHEDLPEGLDRGLVPFADTGSGDLLCFDWRLGKEKPDPPVVIWLHEFIDEDPVVPIAKTFDEFLSILAPPGPPRYFGPLEQLNRRTDK
jgi:hypothetical protein